MGIRDEASRLLHEFKLLAVLEKHGKVYPTGSYQMNMMAHNDLDISIISRDNSAAGLFALAADVYTMLKPYRYDGVCEPEKGKFFCGCETVISGTRWNIDIWLRTDSEIAAAEEYCGRIMQRVSEEPELARVIVDIKTELISLGMYGLDKDPDKHYHSGEIYTAVLDKGARSCADFMNIFPLG